MLRLFESSAVENDSFALTVHEILKLRAHDTAIQGFGELIAGTEAIALLPGAVDSEMIGALFEVSTVRKVAAATGLEEKYIENILHAPEARTVDLWEAKKHQEKKLRRIQPLIAA